jgi:hypothetical protein
MSKCHELRISRMAGLIRLFAYSSPRWKLFVPEKGRVQAIHFSILLRFRKLREYADMRITIGMKRLRHSHLIRHSCFPINLDVKPCESGHPEYEPYGRRYFLAGLLCKRRHMNDVEVRHDSKVL